MSNFVFLKKKFTKVLNFIILQHNANKTKIIVEKVAAKLFAQFYAEK
jgi:hypothetical protein